MEAPPPPPPPTATAATTTPALAVLPTEEKWRAMVSHKLPPEGLSYDSMVTLVCFGDVGVGKTSLIYCYSTGRSIGDCQQYGKKPFETTIGVDMLTSQLQINGYETKVVLWDTAGQERFFSTTMSYVRRAHGIVLVYDVTNARSCENILAWLERVQQALQQRYDPLVLVIGNKVDLPNRAVAQEDAKKLFESLNFLYVETSAQTGLRVRDAIDQLVCALFARCMKQNNVVPGKAAPLVPATPPDPALRLPKGSTLVSLAVTPSLSNLAGKTVQLETPNKREFDVHNLPDVPHASTSFSERWKQSLNPFPPVSSSTGGVVTLSNRHPSAAAYQEDVDHPPIQCSNIC